MVTALLLKCYFLWKLSPKTVLRISFSIILNFQNAAAKAMKAQDLDNSEILFPAVPP